MRSPDLRADAGFAGAVIVQVRQTPSTRFLGFEAEAGNGAFGR